MHNLVWFNEELIDADKARLNALSVSALYGKGIFTTIAVYVSSPFLWEKHWRRLSGDARRLGMDLGKFSEPYVRASLEESINADHLENGRVRITLFDGSASELWPGSDNGRTNLLIVTGDRREIPAQVRLTLSPFRVNSMSPLAGIKSNNYLENVAAIDEARARGFWEAVRLNEREVLTSACMANIFWMKNAELFTPPLSTSCIAGTTREFVLENLPCSEITAGAEDLQKADAIYLTSAGIGIVGITEFDGRPLRSSDAPILGLIKEFAGRTAP